ncbi:glycoside hydrolase family 9 protein [uncultured Draconibacterium sp.]|uniref:glycoside hydrolase family 9 protein n=1 Tax=uncultured Draconibacterium sp. TaxID=1573823 RepID=UPI0025D5B9D8|nr:glycoside hydrolase family 9 protein [uncultured Draconibacterium sp.]
MKKPVLLVLFCLSIIPTLFAQNIHLNSLGFLTDGPKTAVISQSCTAFKVISVSTGDIVFEGETTGPSYQKDVDQEVWKVDFSAVQKSGSYYLEVPGVGRSDEFSIANDAFNFAAVTSMRAFYLWRCGMAVDGEFAGNHYHQDVCHLDDAFEDYIGEKGSKRDGTGGWHDAGDHGKYVVNAGISMGVLFYAWEHFQPQLEKMDLDIPETAPGFPDFLQELKWETDWILKMQYPDGSGRVSHKLTRTNFSGFIMASDDDAKRYFTEWSSAATADFVGIMAMAARYFKPYDAVYAQKCLDAAWVSYRFLQESPEYKRFEQGDFETGGYQSKDEDDRLWAAAELWATTGDEACLKDFEKRAAAIDYEIKEDWDWQNVSNLAMYSYALSSREGKNSEVEKNIRKNIVANADAIVEKGKTDVYSRALGGRYYWGCNGTVARQTLNLQVANLIQPNPKYKQAAIGIVDHIFGKNYYNRSYVTGLGINPPMHPHDRRSGADNIEAPWPGYLVGGGHSATDWEDKEASYSKNEIAINWQAALVYALAGFVSY